MRDRSWNIARLKHDIAKRRLEKTRKEAQLRWEREQAWNEAHQQYNSSRKQAAVELQRPAECPACASLSASYPTKNPNLRISKDVTWWERPDALAVQHIGVPRTPVRHRTRKYQRDHAHGLQGSQTLRDIVQRLRDSIRAADAHRRAWEAKFKTESAVRRKHSLNADFKFEPDFWTSPIPNLISRRNHRQIQQAQRMVERRARGNTLRSRPPRSSLSYSESSDQLHIEPIWVHISKEQEAQEELERQARKIREEVGYLYFVGDIDGMEEWKEDYRRSDRSLVVRTYVANSESPEISWSDPDLDEEPDDMDVDLPQDGDA